MSRYGSLVLNALAGAALSAAYAPWSWFSLALLSPALALALWRQPLRRAVLGGWTFGFAHFGTSVYWVYYSLHDFGNAPALLAVTLSLIFVASLALYFALLAGVVAYVARRVSVVPLCLLLFPSLWVMSEWLRSVLLTGFPWNIAGQALIDSPFAAVLPIFGASGASWLAVFLAGCLVLVFSRRVVAFVAAVVVVSAALSVQLFEWTVPDGDEIEVALVQSNVQQDLKFDRTQFLRIVEIYRSLTQRAVGADLVVWPETALPAYYDLLEEKLLLPLRDQVRAGGGELVLGAFVRDGSDASYNAIVQVGQPPQIYRKRHLVPFGEYLPLRGLLEFFRSWILIPMSDLKAGTARPLIRLAGRDVGASICYEVVFADEIRKALPQAAYLLNLSNDSWFGDSPAPHQHLQIARLRAAETGRAMVRATNTGISAIINHYGEVVVRSRQFTEQLLLATVEPRRGQTPYVIWGDAPVLLWSTLTLLIGFGFAWKQQR